MRLLDTYATNTGSTIDTPFIFPKYFPTPVEKYITIQTQTPYDSRNYEYWQDVIDILNPILSKHNIKIIHTGLKDDRKYHGVIDILGQTDINQLAYIVNNSTLHLGADSFCVHLASYYDKPIVALYSISNPNVAGPHFGNKDKHCLIKAYENIGNKKPSYSPSETPKSINTVKPEQIVKEVLKLLNIKHELNYETLFIGERYTNRIIEAFADQVLPNDLVPQNLLNIRLDYTSHIDNQVYNAILNNLNIRPCSLITDKPINLQPFLQFKERLNSIFYNITTNVDTDFINHAMSLGFKIFFIFDFYKSNEFTLNKRKLELIDYSQNIEVIKKPENINLENINNLYYKTNKLLFANGKAYLSKAAQESDKAIFNLNENWIQPLSDIQNLKSFIENDIWHISLIKKS